MIAILKTALAVTGSHPAAAGEFITTLSGYPAGLQAIAIAAGTLLSEDLSAICGGILAGAAPANFPAILVGCWAGMWIGDMVYFFLGFGLGKRALSLPVLKRIVSEKKYRNASVWFSEKGLLVMILSRALPGTRPATYLAAGILRFRPGRFIVISLTLSLLWALFLTLLSMHIGSRIMALAESLHLGILSPILSALLILLFVLFLTRLPGRIWRRPSRGEAPPGKGKKAPGA